MTNRAWAWLAASTLASALAACGDARSAAARGEGAAATCTACHGGTDDGTGAPPRDLKGRTATSEVTVGAHPAHVKAGSLAGAIDCTACHLKPATISSPGHLDGAQKIVWGGLANAMGAAPSWDGASATCSNVYCHGTTLSGGSNVSPRWTVVDGSQAACGTCHGLPPSTPHPTLAVGTSAATCALCHPATVKTDGGIDVAGGRHVNGRVETEGFAGHGAGWMVAGDPASHGQAAVSQGTDACFRCHSAKDPSTNGIRTCASCHDAMAGGVDWTTSCIGCHGSATATAPPKDVHGNTVTTAVGVGAHRSHVEATHGLAQAYGCSVCHVTPAEVFSPSHLDGAAVVTGYTGTDQGLEFVKDPGWNRASATCATAYCHGATLGGGTASRPLWTKVDGSQATCGSCHGMPPSAPHPALASGTPASTCALCHLTTVRTDGNIDLLGGKHVNGLLEADDFAGHGAGWLVPGDPASHGQTAIAQGMDACFRCHAAKDPSTNGIRTCASCHDALAGGGDWTTSCIGCHGSGTTSAPPKDVHGNSATTAIGVGAHRSHVEATHGLARAYDCDVCHVNPPLVFSPGHLDGATMVSGYTGSDPALQFIADPGWNRTTITCSTSWCHGGYSGTFTYWFDDGSGTQVQIDFAYAGKAARPTWTKVDGTQAACGTCHEAPPRGSAWHSGLHAGGNGCDLCHPGTKPDGAGFTDSSRHVNGLVDVEPTWATGCFNCH